MAVEGQKTGALRGNVRDDMRHRRPRLDASQNETLFRTLVPHGTRTGRETAASTRARIAPDPQARGRVFKIAAKSGCRSKKSQVYSDLGIEEPAEDDDTLAACRHRPLATMESDQGDPAQRRTAEPGRAASSKMGRDPTTDTVITKAANVWGSIFKGHTQAIRTLAEGWPRAMARTRKSWPRSSGGCRSC